MSFASVYPLYVAKAERKGRGQAEVDEIIRWLTGYSAEGLQAVLDDGRDFRRFFDEAPERNPLRSLITGTVCGVALPPGLRRASKLPQPIFTPATKAEAGQHDENITFERMAAMVGAARAAEVRDTAIRLYREAADYALGRGIIIADTKFEFGLDAAGRLHLIDEALTPDSSRFWPLDTWREGESPESFDKQYVRNWLDAIGFDRKPPAPPMPPDVAARTSEKYQEAARRLMG